MEQSQSALADPESLQDLDLGELYRRHLEEGIEDLDLGELYRRHLEEGIEGSNFGELYRGRLEEDLDLGELYRRHLEEGMEDLDLGELYRRHLEEVTKGSNFGELYRGRLEEDLSLTGIRERSQKFFTEFPEWFYSSSTRRVNIQSSDGRGQVTNVGYEDKEVRSHVKGAVNTSETVREGKVTTQKGSQGHKKQEPVTKSAESSSYVKTSKEDICTSHGLSSTPATSGQPPALEFSSSPSPPPPPPLAPAAAAPPPPSTSPTPPEPRDEITQLAEKLLKAVNSKKKSDQDSLTVLSEQLGGSVIMIQNTVNNNHYHTHYHNHNNTCEEVRVETSETVNVCVGGPLKVYQQRQPQDDDNGDEDVDKNSHGTDSDKENDDDEDSDDHTMYVDLDDENMEK